MIKSEFTVPHAYQYDHTTAIRWIASHVWRYKGLVITTVILILISYIAYDQGPILIGRAAQEIIHPTGGDTLLWVAFGVLFF